MPTMAPSQPSFTENDLVRSICKESFYEFVKEFWPIVVPETPVWNWHIPYLCRELQRMAERLFRGEPKQYDLIINIPPGTTKSTICSIMFPAWLWTRMPSCRVIGGSYTQALALNLSRINRNLVESEQYQATFADVGPLRIDQNTKSHYETEKGGSRYAVGVGGTVTGMHGHVLIIDDPINPKQAASEAELLTANLWMRETLPTRKVDKDTAFTILIMQRLHQNDPTGNMLAIASEQLPVRHICLPGELTENVKPEKLRARYVDGLLDPVRLSRSVLKGLETQLGEYGYAGQIKQSPIPSGGATFKPERIVTDTVNERAVTRVRYWDKAATAGGGKYSAGVLLGKDSTGRFWVLDVVRGQWSTEQREAIIKATAQLDGKDVWIGLEQEPGSGGKDSALATVRALAGFKVFVERPTGEKEVRATPFSVQVNNRNVSMDRQARWARAYEDELRHFPFGTYSDQVDASSGAFNRLAPGPIRVGGGFGS